jgi:hypothetical protein
MAETLRELTAGDCPVCLDLARCVLCDGDHRTLNAREVADRDLRDMQTRLRRIDPRRDPASAQEVFRIVGGFVRTHTGLVEIARVPAFRGGGHTHLAPALARLGFVLAVLDKLRS